MSPLTAAPPVSVVAANTAARMNALRRAVLGFCCRSSMSVCVWERDAEAGQASAKIPTQGERIPSDSGGPQADNRLEALTGRLAQLDVAVVLLDEAADDCEPEATALARAVPPETIERAVALF